MTIAQQLYKKSEGGQDGGLRGGPTTRRQALGIIVVL